MLPYWLFTRSQTWKRKPVHRYGIFVVLFALANGMVGFILPLLVEDGVSSLFWVGVILASSSIWDIVADTVLGSIFPIKSYLRLAFYACATLIALVLGLWLSPSIWMLVVAMVLWGFYIEFYDFATYKFVQAYHKPKQYGFAFGFLQQAKSLGYVVAPMIAGYMVLVSHRAALGSILYFVAGAAVFLGIQYATGKLRRRKSRRYKAATKRHRRISLYHEVRLWKRLGRYILPLGGIFFAFGLIDGGITSFLPIMVENTDNLRWYGGVIFSAYSLSMVLFSGVFGKLADKYGHRHLIVLGTVLSALSMMSLGYAVSPLWAWLSTLGISLGVSLFLPSIQSELELLCITHETDEDALIGETNTVLNLGFIAGAFLVGAIRDWSASFGLAFLVIGVIILGALGSYLSFARVRRT